jgi:hypothetical protein
MADNNNTPQVATEFQALPLEYMITAPLVGAVKAQYVSALATQSFIQGMIDAKTGEPIAVEFTFKRSIGGSTDEIDVSAPLLAIVPVPHLRIDNITTHFHFEVTQSLHDATELTKGVQFEVATGKALSPWVSASLKGSVSSKATTESTTNRSGQLDITVQASQGAIPEGLARILSLMTSAIQLPESSDDGKGKKKTG